ncbi:hypothetical protein F3Y22_tig00111392pilonHSYRG00720 [Hibiscus syriacus]|uniref:Bms1-type G domain-containing protein n=1 Tax=Hibiscus syriacus TaxID=106335 RepID=A0A6A2YLZ8_HIBSY|nr:hypothetical protein F3Y22_tig00111392pilonHSYRG00720 [Hibiscus syriacus]
MGGSRAQVSKAHKTRFASKSSRNIHKTLKIDKNRIAKPSRNVAQGARAAWHQRSKMLREQKKAAVLKEKRASSGSAIPPRVILLFPLSASVNLSSLAEDILRLLSTEAGEALSSTVASSEYKLRATVMQTPHGDLLSCMEMAKVADLIAFVASATEESTCDYIDSFGSHCLSVLRSLGLPSTVVFIRDLPTELKRRNDAKKIVTSNLTSVFPEDYDTDEEDSGAEDDGDDDGMVLDGGESAFPNQEGTNNPTLRKIKLPSLKMEQEGRDECAPAGSYARLYIKDVPLHVASKFIKKVDSYDAPVKAKEELIFHVGFRQFVARPIFSTDNINSDKHKMERFLHAGRFSIASVYAPISFPPLPLIALKGAAGAEDYINWLSSTGIQVKSVRYMFHNPEDVRWFKPVEVWTKYGRVKEPVGTHGAMKCVFNGGLQQHDTVCMSLYKRAYPKWPEHRFPVLDA